jgi:8-oxo-dGTP pyrophosphatase MutT (NUDIX family)
MYRHLLLLAVLISAGGCADSAPPCPFTGAAHTAPSAGCFAASSQGLLLVQAFNGKLSPPGGSSESGESARCTAFRETWEETGLHLQPGKLLQVFDTGFHLYRCESDRESREIDPPPRFEVRAVFYLPADRFDDYEWRFPDQQLILKNLLLKFAVDLSD